jgi:DNA invertase Pin-like site-specific DNA recombinase
MEKLTKLTSKPIVSIYTYTRVSTGKQANDDKHGLSSQSYLCGEYINKFYPDIKDVINWRDVGSSYKTHQILPEMSNLLQKIKSNSLLLISEVSRLGRSLKMVDKILKIVRQKKSFIISINENLIYGKTKLNDYHFLKKISHSEKESENLSMRIKNTHNYIRQNGGYIGKPPFGYKIEKNSRNIPILKEKSQDFELIDSIIDLTYVSYSYKEITEKMNSMNKFHNNKLWTTTKIKNILNKFYPEHVLLNVNDKQIKTSLQNRVKNTIYYNLKITVNDNIRNVYYLPSSSPLHLKE